MHITFKREVGMGKRYQYRPGMCTQAPDQPEDRVCAICWCEYEEEDNPASTHPGCKAKPPHFYDTKKDYKQPTGLDIGSKYAHQSCVFQFIEMNGSSYCSANPDVYQTTCPHCLWE